MIIVVFNSFVIIDNSLYDILAMYRHNLLRELETKYEARFNLYPEHELRHLGYCFELLLIYEKLTKQKLEFYRKIAHELQRILRSKMVVLKEDLDVIYVKEGWKIIKNNIERLKRELKNYD